MLVRMLRTEIGEVSNRGAWVDPSMATPEIMQLYKAPLRLRGWANAIMEVRSAAGTEFWAFFASAATHQDGIFAQVTRAEKVGRRRILETLTAVEDLPALLLTGAGDRCAVLILIAHQPFCMMKSLEMCVHAKALYHHIWAAYKIPHVLAMQSGSSANGGRHVQPISKKHLCDLASRWSS